MSKRLKSSHWFDAYKLRLGANLIPFYIIKKGDPDAGAMFIRVDETALWTPQFNYDNDAREWVIIAEGDAIEPYLAKLNKIDPDYWLIDVERHGDRELFTDGL